MDIYCLVSQGFSLILVDFRFLEYTKLIWQMSLDLVFLKISSIFLWNLLILCEFLNFVTFPLSLFNMM